MSARKAASSQPQRKGGAAAMPPLAGTGLPIPGAYRRPALMRERGKHMTKKRQAKKEPKAEERCPNCGYCKHCGQAKPVAPVLPVIPTPPGYWCSGCASWVYGAHICHGYGRPWITWSPIISSGTLTVGGGSPSQSGNTTTSEAVVSISNTQGGGWISAGTGEWHEA